MIDQNILWFDVSVNNAIFMQMMNCQTNLTKVELGLLLIHFLNSLELLEEFSTWAVLQSKAHPTLCLKYANQFTQKGVSIIFQCYHNVTLILYDLKFVMLLHKLFRDHFEGHKLPIWFASDQINSRKSPNSNAL